MRRKTKDCNPLDAGAKSTLLNLVFVDIKRSQFEQTSNPNNICKTWILF